MKMHIRKRWFGLAVTLFLAGFIVQAQTRAQDLPIPNYPAVKDVPGAKELPNPDVTYKVVFDIAKAASAPDQVNPGLIGVARFVNTMAKYGVPMDHRKVAVIFHQAATPIIENNETFKGNNNGTDNPNIDLIRSLKKAGVEFHVCGQSVVGHKIDPKTIQPEIELDLWALTTMLNLETRGYIHMGE